MLKKYKGTLILSSLVALLPVLVGLILWNRLPEQVAMHWNAQGEVDGWAAKWVAVFGMPLFVLAIQWICLLVTSIEPKSKNVEGKPLQLVLWICPFISVLVCGITYLTALEIPVSVEVIMPMVLGAMFMLIGNYMPKCRQSYTLGIKTPWALEDEENWYCTHRFAGRLWMAGGALCIAASLFGFVLFFAIVLVMGFAPMIYSYLYYRKKHREE